MEPPSESLQQLLAECGLCRPGELKKCRGRVRRLVHDLPAFDSVWIDALLQARVVTGFQAQVLASPDPGRLRVGPCVLVDRLGGGRWSETCVAEVIGQHGERRVLKRLVVPSDILESVASRLGEVVQAADGVKHPGIVAPRAARRAGPELVLGSRYVDGPSLRDLLVRRGRFPAEVVEEIGGGLVEALSEFEAVGLVHGDLTANNVRLDSRGRAVAVDAGVAAAIEPMLVVDVTRSPERYDGISPERAASSGVATVGSDMYALGCLLFELLAGRPPFPVADAVMKLNAHQESSVADVREWAPDVPPALAERVNCLCTHDAKERPGSWRSVCEEWNVRRGGKNTQGRRFRRQMRSAAPVVHVAKESGRGRLPMGVAGTVAAVVLAVVAWSGQHWFSSSSPVVVSASAEGVVIRPGVPTEIGDRGRDVDRNWPAPDAGGMISLDESRIWTGVRLENPVSLVLTGRGRGAGPRPEIVIESGRPLELNAPVVELQGLKVRGPVGEPWVVIHGGVVRVSDCTFVAKGESDPGLRSVAVEVVGPDRQRGVYVEWRRVLVRHPSGGLRIRAAEAEVSAVDVLQIGGETWLEWQRPPGATAGSLVLDMRHCTLRRARRLLEWSGGSVRADIVASVLSIRTGGLLCDLAVGAAGPVSVRGRGTLVTPGTVATLGRGNVEGLSAAVPTFVGPATDDPRDSELSRPPVGVPGIGEVRPGIRKWKQGGGDVGAGESPGRLLKVGVEG